MKQALCEKNTRQTILVLNVNFYLIAKRLNVHFISVLFHKNSNNKLISEFLIKAF